MPCCGHDAGHCCGFVEYDALASHVDLIQVAFAEHIFVFDTQVFPLAVTGTASDFGVAGLRSLFSILGDASVVKVMQACGNDALILRRSYDGRYFCLHCPRLR